MASNPSGTLRDGVGHPAGRLGTVSDRFVLTPGRITLVYLAFGTIALVFSDLYLPTVLSGETLIEIQALKGAVEVAVTAGLLYALTATSHAALRRTAVEAERSRTELQLLHRVLRHNLRNNLTLLLGKARGLESDLDDPADSERCKAVIAAAEEIETWTEQAGQIRRVTADSEPVTVDLAETVSRVLARIEAPDGAAIETAIPDDARVRVGPQFEAAIEELVTNAVEHGSTGPDARPTVRISVNRQGDRTVVLVDDDGPGFPEHVLEAVNGRGEDKLVHLDGLGLWLAFLIVVNANGELVLENDPDGATARITAPAA